MLLYQQYALVLAQSVTITVGSWQVILTRWKPDGVPDYNVLQSRSKAMWRKPAWARGVLVDDQSSSGHPLLSSIVQVIPQ